MSVFKTKLRVELIDSRGSGIWQLTSPFVYTSDVLDTVLVVPAFFVTDFASVPRLPIAYSIVGNTSHEAAVLHDWLYSPKCKEPCDRAQADAVLYEAALISGAPKWKAYLIWLAVRLFGSQFYKAK